MVKRREKTLEKLTNKLVDLTDVHAPASLSNAVRERKLAPHAGTLHFIPRDEKVESKLIEVEKLIRRGSYTAALREARLIEVAGSGLASSYALMVQEKVARANVALGDRYLARGDRERATSSYRAAIEARDGDAGTRAVAGIAGAGVRELVARRTELLDTLRTMITESKYERWCETRRGIREGSILDHVRDLTPDIRLEELLDPRKPVGWPPRENPQGGWTDPAPIDEVADNPGLGGILLDRPTLVPGGSFTALSAKPIALDTLQRLAPAPAGAQTLALRASTSLPLMASTLTAHARLFAIEHNLSVIGLSAGSVPLFRSSYLIEQGRRALTFLADVDSKMLTMQIEVDDFSELIETIRRHANEQSAELQALETRISDLQTTVTTLEAGDGELGKVVQKLEAAEDDCEPEWWEYLVSVLVVIAATAIGAGIGFLLGGIPGAIAGGISSLILSIGLTIQVWNDREITCDNVTQARQDFQSAHSALKAALADTRAELQHTLLQRDTVIASLVSLQDAYDEAVTSNQARVLNAATLSRILGVLDGVRRSVVVRAHAMAQMAQEAYNAENDSRINVIAGSHTDYLDESARGYTASALLRRDLDGLEHVRITGQTRKRMQLTQTVSLSKHYPTSFASILTSGNARFATRLTDFDRWFPGTYMQRLKEVSVEVLVDGEPRPIRGYLSSDGVSFVRFPDHGNKVAIDNRDVFADPDDDLKKLCYKRRRRHHAVETMAFPSFDSVLYDARSTDTQRQERNFFEGCGLESTWRLELMPDQVLEYARITDVRVSFQFEAFFDPALKRVVEAKRYKDRNETALVSVKKLLAERGIVADFSQPVEAPVTAFHFEAPHLEKDIRDVALMIRPKQAPLLPGVARLRLGYQGEPPIEVETNEQGIVATADTKPAGTNTTALRTLTQGKSALGVWTIEILELPEGFQIEDIDDVLLMIRYTFAS
jgi:hypothetical protein